MKRGFFVTGTDTGVGKTVIAGALIRAIKILGLRPFGMKPIETGTTPRGNLLMPSDGVFLKDMAQMDESINHITPYCLENPLSPMVASEMENVSIDAGRIKREFDELMKTYDAAVVEGVGGLLVPIKSDYFVIDLARDIGLPLMVVARPTLGTINHIMLTVNYALKEGLKVAGVIINYSRPPEGTLAEETNPQALKKLLPVPFIGVFPHMREMSSEAIDKAAIKYLNLGVIKNELFPDSAGGA
jgi:dethiobiotin synthetase